MAREEPEGWNGETTITLLSNAGKPWQGGYIIHNGRKYYTNKDGQVRLRINGGAVLANEYPVTKLVKGKVSLTLQHDMWRGGVYEKSISSNNTPLPHPVGSQVL